MVRCARFTSELGGCDQRGALRETGGSGVFEVVVGDADDFDALYADLRGVPEIVVEAVPAPVTPGDQGTVVDLLTVACSGGALTVFLRIIKTLAESRGRGFAVKIRRGKDQLEITAKNADEALPMIKEWLDGS